MTKPKHHNKQVFGKAKETERVSGENQDDLSSLLLKRPLERDGAPISPQLRKILNAVVQNYPQVLPFKKGDVRVLNRISFRRLYADRNRSESHPYLSQVLAEISQRFGFEYELAFVSPTINFFTDLCRRSPYIYVDESHYNKGLTREGLRGFRPDQKEEIKTLQRVMNSTTLLEENIHRSCIPRVHSVDTDRKRRGLENIVYADAYNKLHQVGKEAIGAYATAILDYLEGKEVKILSTGIRLLVVTEGKFIAGAQYNANEVATTYFVRPMVNDFMQIISQELPLFRLLFGQVDEEQMLESIMPRSSRTSALEVPEERIVSELRDLAGSSYEEQFNFYISGNYFGKRMDLAPEVPFLF